MNAFIKLVIVLSIACYAQVAIAKRIPPGSPGSRAHSNEQNVSELTESQKILSGVMQDIRNCDKTTRYEYSPKLNELRPPTLMKINGIKKMKLIKNEWAVFSINETYEGLHAVQLLVGQADGPYEWPMVSAVFREDFHTARKRIESAWQVRFTDAMRPGPDVITEGNYAEIETQIDDTRRFLKIEKMPKDVYPFIGLTTVGCNRIQY